MYSNKPNDYDKYVYETELKDFLPDEIIDFHCHISHKDTPLEGDSNGGSTWTELVVGRDKSAENLIECHKELFPQNKVGRLVFGSCSTRVDETNKYVEEMGRKYNFPTLYRTDYIMTKEELENGIRKGGHLGIKPYLTFCPKYIPASEIRIFDFLTHEHLEVCNKLGCIVMLHIPRDLRLKDPVNLYQIKEIEERYPNIKLIVAHIGRAYAKEDIGNAFDIIGKGKNTYFDFCANVCDDAIEECIKAVGTKKILWGTDLPIASMRMYRVTENGIYYNVVPRGLYGKVEGEPHMRETDEKNVTNMVYEIVRAFKRVSTKLKLSDKDVEDVMCNNAKSIMQSVNF